MGKRDVRNKEFSLSCFNTIVIDRKLLACACLLTDGGLVLRCKVRTWVRHVQIFTSEAWGETLRKREIRKLVYNATKIHLSQSKGKGVWKFSHSRLLTVTIYTLQCTLLYNSQNDNKCIFSFLSSRTRVTKTSLLVRQYTFYSSIH